MTISDIDRNTDKYTLSDAIHYIMNRSGLSIIIPAMDVNICYDAFILINKNLPKCSGQERIRKIYQAVQRALNKDKRFSKFTHITGMIGYEIA